MDDVVLCAQASDYREFLAQQRKTRFRTNNFDTFVDEVRKRRIKYGLHDEICLLQDPKQNTRLQNWIEFQDYHLTILERMEREQNESRQQADHAGEHAGRWEDILERIGRNIAQHRVLLDWIEQWRQIMDSTPPRRDPTRPRPSARARRKRGSKVSPASVLGQAKVTKAQPERKPSIWPFDIKDTSRTGMPSPRRRSTKDEPPGSKDSETSLRPFRPQRVSSVIHFEEDTAKPRWNTLRSTRRLQSPDRAMRRLAPRLPQPACHMVITRSGRTSRPPVRWVPA